MFSLYSLAYLPQQLDSALAPPDLELSDLRDNTVHIANIWGHDKDVTYDGLQRAVLNLSRMFTDTMSLSLHSGGVSSVLLPLTANVTDFPELDSESSLYSFQSSLVESFQTSLTTSNTNSLLATPQEPISGLVPIVPQPLRAPMASTPTGSTQGKKVSSVFHKPRCLVEEDFPTMESSSLMTQSTLEPCYGATSTTFPMDTVVMKTVMLSPGRAFLNNSNSELLLGYDSDLLSTSRPPTVTMEDLSFAEAATRSERENVINMAMLSSPAPPPSPKMLMDSPQVQYQIVDERAAVTPTRMVTPTRVSTTPRVVTPHLVPGLATASLTTPPHRHTPPHMWTPCPRDASFTTYEEFARRYQAYYYNTLDEETDSSEDSEAVPTVYGYSSFK